MLDLDGDGIELIAPRDTTAFFDIDNDGFREKVGWVGADDGLLVRDLNGNGRIDDLTEMFGSNTQNAFADLATHDSNGDGKITVADAVFASLRVWRDADGDGTTDAGELLTLTAAGVASINLAAQNVNLARDGNTLAFTGSFQRTDGSLGQAGAVYFGVNQLIAKWTPPADFEMTVENAILPHLKGYGDVPDIYYATSQDVSLRTAVENLVLNCAGMEGAAIRTAFEGIIAKWTGTETISASGRGPHVDGQHLAVLEEFYGAQFVQRVMFGTSTNPDPVNGKILEGVYGDLVNSMLTHFLAAQAVSYSLLMDDENAGLSSPFLPLVGFLYYFEADRLYGGFDAFFQYLIEHAPSGESAAQFYWRQMETAFAGLKSDRFGGDEAAYIGAVITNTSTMADQSMAEYVNALAADGDRLIGSWGNETVTGTAAAEVIAGTRGADVLQGGAGNDSYVYARGDGQDTITDAHNKGGANKLVFAGVDSTDVTLVRTGDTVTLVIAASAAGAGDGGSVKLTGQFDSAHGNGVETIVFADGTVWTPNDLRLMALAQASTAGADTIVGFNVADTIRGGAGNDAIDGYKGDDTYIYARGDGDDTITDWYNNGAADRLVLQGVNVSDVTLVRSGDDVTLVIAANAAGAGGSVKLIRQLDTGHGVGLETIVFADGAVWTPNDLRLMVLAQASTAGDDTIVGFNAPDTIRGGAGNDAIDGYKGDDTYIYGRGDGHDTITDWYNNGAADRLVLEGIHPAAVMLTRTGDDVTVVIAESAPGAGDGGSVKLIRQSDGGHGVGIDTIVFADGTVWDRAAIKAAAWWRGTAGADAMPGSTGADTMAGGAGDDSYIVNHAGDVVVEEAGAGDDLVQASISNTLGANVERLTLTGSAALNATGNALANTLIGNTAANILDGGAGADAMAGGAGDDIYVVDNAADVVTEAAGEGVDLVRTALSHTLAAEVENLMLIGSTAANGTGNALDNVLTGNAAANILNGGAGSDTMTGGAGDDTYIVTVATDVVGEAANEGVDLVRSSISHVLEANVENLTLTGTAFVNASGNTLGNVLTGNAGANTLNGLAGADTMTGGAGDDLYAVDSAGDTVVELAGEGVDTVRSAVSFALAGGHADHLILTSGGHNNAVGNGLANTLTGNAGDNALNGGGGSDTLTGGAGADAFVFASALGTANVDTVTDFAVADDVIRIDDAVFAGLGSGPLAAGAFAIGTAAADAGDRIIYNGATGELFFDQDGSGTAHSAIRFAAVTAHLALTAEHFVVV